MGSTTFFANAHAQLPKLPKQLIDVLSCDHVQSMEDAAKAECDELIIRILGTRGSA